MRTDNYQWTINYTGGTPTTGTFLDGTPWIFPNGATLTFVGVSPSEVEITTTEGTGLVQRTIINPDFNKFFREESIRGASFDDEVEVLTCVGSTTPNLLSRIPFDYRAGTDRTATSNSQNTQRQITISLSELLLDGVTGGNMKVTKSRGYTLDQSDPSNSGDQLQLFTDSDRTELYSGFTYTGTPGTDGALHFIIPSDTDDPLFYSSLYMKTVSGIEGGSISIDTIGRLYDKTQGVTQTNGVVEQIILEPGDMIITQTAFTGDFQDGESDSPFTESWGCFTVVGQVPPSNAFRPPINWDPTDKANRPILTEGDTFGDDQVSYPNYDLTSDTKSWTDTTIAYDDNLLNRLGTIHPNFSGGADLASLRGTIKSQSMVGDEYGGVQAIEEERMMVSCFDPNVSGATQDLLRRTIAQRGIDIWGSMYSQGKHFTHNGYHMGEWNPKVYFAYAVTRDSRIFDMLDFKFGNTGNGTYKEYLKEKSFGLKRLLGYHETEQSSVGHVLCSFRHFDLNVIESGLTGGVPYIVIEKPTTVLQGGSRRISYHIESSPNNRAGGLWSFSNNTGNADPNLLRSTYIRTKGTGGGITRVIYGAGYSGGIDEPDSITLYLQEDVVGGGANGITGCDLSNALVETRQDLLNRTITYEESNTGSESSIYTYTYSVVSHLLSNYLLSQAIGFENLPKWGETQKEKAETIFTTIEGKNLLFSGINASYNLGSKDTATEQFNTLYHALCRQEIANGVSLDAGLIENDKDDTSVYSDPSNWYPLPETKTWEELQEITTNIDNAICTTPFIEGNNANPFYVIGSGETIGEPKWFQFIKESDDTAKLVLTDSQGMTWDNFTGKPYLWPKGATFAVGMTLESTTATGTGDTSWNATWVFDELIQPFTTIVPDFAGVSIIFERNI